MSSYDQTLLAEVPKATRAQLQEGYSVDLLEQPPRRTPSVRNPPPQTPQPPVPVTPAIPEAGSGEKLGSALTPAEPKPRTSFWRSRNGVITIVVIALVVIGAVVGGAVGGTVKKSGKTTVETTGTNSTSSSSGASLSNLPPSSTQTEAVGQKTTTQTQALGGQSTGSVLIETH